MTKLEKLTQYLQEQMTITSVYTGGGPEDNYLSLERSDGMEISDKDEVIKYLAIDILKIIES